MPLNYNADVEKWTFFLRWKHTVLPMVAKDPVFWLLMGVHMYILQKQKALIEEGSSLPALDWKASSMLWSLLTFFVVFYGGHCYARFYTFYGACTGLGGVLGEFAYLIRSHFDASPALVKWNMLRLMLGGMEIQLASLGGTDSGGSKGLSDSEWDRIHKHGFLSRSEIASLQKYKGSKPFLPAVWALTEVRCALKAKLSKTPPSAPSKAVPALPESPLDSSKSPGKKAAAAAESDAEATLLMTPAAMAVLNDFEQAVLKFKSNCGQATNLLKMPVPFAYFHVLKLLLIISLVLTSYALVELEHAQVLMSMIVFTIITVIMIGLQAVAVAMSDPFGDDDIDFDLEAFLKGAYDNAVALITDQRVALHNTLPADMDSNFPLADTQAAVNARSFTNAFDASGNKRVRPVCAPAVASSPSSLPKGAPLPSPPRERPSIKRPSNEPHSNSYKRLEESPSAQ